MAPQSKIPSYGLETYLDGIECAHKFSNSKLKSHFRFYPHQAEEVLNLYLFTTYNSILSFGNQRILNFDVTAVRA